MIFCPYFCPLYSFVTATHDWLSIGWDQSLFFLLERCDATVLIKMMLQIHRTQQDILIECQPPGFPTVPATSWSSVNISGVSPKNSEVQPGQVWTCVGCRVLLQIPSGNIEWPLLTYDSCLFEWTFSVKHRKLGIWGDHGFLLSGSSLILEPLCKVIATKTTQTPPKKIISCIEFALIER